jgi:crotonobetainyl-CoA:carnitine CoA-transferase CaiB-like acyl-CoA transferase
MRPLEGVRIIDLTVAVAGPVAAQLLGDLGADVIRVEPPFPRPTSHLDVAPASNGVDDRPYNRVVSQNDLQRSKRGIMLDLQREAGRDALLRLVAVADVVIENMAPRVLPSLRLAYDDLCAVRSDIVLVSMPAFGGDGPLRERVSFGPGIDAMSGLSHLTGYADRGPMNAALYYCDYNAAALAATATLAALWHRARTGEGQRVELAMLEGELQLLAPALLDYEMNGRELRRTGNAHPSMAPHGVYACAGDDRWVALACEGDAQWAALCGAIGRPELARDARYADVVSRIRGSEALDAIVEEWTSARSAGDAAAALQAAGVPASPVRTMPDLLADPSSRERGWVQDVRHREAGVIPHTRAGFALSRTPMRIERAAPLFGEHNDEVLRHVAGLSDAEMDALRAHGVVRDAPPTTRLA